MGTDKGPTEKHQNLCRATSIRRSTINYVLVQSRGGRQPTTKNKTKLIGVGE